MSQFDKVLKNKKMLALLSVLIAFLAWISIAIFVNPEIKKTITIPVKIDSNAQALKSAGVGVVDQRKDQKIEVLVLGDRTIIGGLTANDFVVTPDLSQVNGPGEYTFPVHIEKKDSMKNFNILTTTKTIVIKLDVMATKTLPVEPLVEGVTIGDGFIRGEIFSSPETITLRGPKSIVEKVEKCQVYISDRTTLKDTKVYAREFESDELRLLDKDANILTKDQKEKISTEITTINITVPVLQKATLPVRVDFLGLPSTLAKEDLKYKLSHSEIEIAGPKEAVEKLKEISIGYYDLRNFKQGKKITLDVKLPTGFISLQNIKKVTLEFDKNYKDSKSITVSNINIINKPENYKIELETEKLYNVQLAGDPEQLKKVNASDLVGEIDLSNVDVSKGTMSVVVEIKLPNYNKVWATGNYNATIKVSDK